MFRVDRDAPFQGLHQSGEILTDGERPEHAKAAVILIHGRGASAESILQLVQEFTIPGVHYTAPQTTSILCSLGGDVDERIYPRMGHTVNREEMGVMESMIRQIAATDNGSKSTDEKE